VLAALVLEKNKLISITAACILRISYVKMSVTSCQDKIIRMEILAIQTWRGGGEGRENRLAVRTGILAVVLALIFIGLPEEDIVAHLPS
jgi:hypothetical protein